MMIISRPKPMLFISILVVFLSFIVQLSCSKETKPDESFITINNLTNGVANLIFPNSQTATVQANDDYKWYYLQTDKDVGSDSLYFQYDGDFLMPGTKIVDLSANNGDHVDLVSDCARLALINQSNAVLTVSVRNQENLLGEFDIPANQTQFMKENRLNDGDTLLVRYDGRYTFLHYIAKQTDYNVTTEFRLSPDAGSLEVTNAANMSLTISGVYIADAGTSAYGTNQLSWPLYYGDYRMWKLLPRHCDIKITYSGGGETIYPSHDIIVNQTQSIVVSGK